MKFCQLHKNKQIPWKLADFVKKKLGNCQLHENKKKLYFAGVIKTRLFPTSWRKHDPWNFADVANLMKITKNHEIWPTLWKWAKTMKFGQHYENEQKPWNFANFFKKEKTKNSPKYSIRQHHENKQKPWDIFYLMKIKTDFMKISKDHEILSTSWK